jgi:hypothetical protein
MKHEIKKIEFEGMPSVPKASVLLMPFIASNVLFAFANLKWKEGGRGY